MNRVVFDKCSRIQIGKPRIAGYRFSARCREVRFSEIGNESSTSQIGVNRSKRNAGEKSFSGHFFDLILPKKLPNCVLEIYFPVINYLEMWQLQKLERVKGIEPSWLLPKRLHEETP